MKDNFGLGAFGLDTIEYPEKSQPIFRKVSDDEKEKREIQYHLQQLKNIKKYYEKHPDAILPSCEFGSKSHRDENGSIVMERTYRRK